MYDTDPHPFILYSDSVTTHKFTDLPVARFPEHEQTWCTLTSRQTVHGCGRPDGTSRPSSGNCVLVLLPLRPRTFPWSPPDWPQKKFRELLLYFYVCLIPNRDDVCKFLLFEEYSRKWSEDGGLCFTSPKSTPIWYNAEWIEKRLRLCKTLSHKEET